MKKDLNFRRFVIVFCFFSVLSLFVFGGLLFKVYQQSVQSSNKVVATFVAEIQKKDSDISDEEILQQLMERYELTEEKANDFLWQSQ